MTYTFKSQQIDIDIDRIIDENNGHCKIIESGKYKFAIITNSFYLACKGINTRFNFERLYKRSYVYNDKIIPSYNIESYVTGLVWHCFESDYSYELFKGSIKQWLIQIEKNAQKVVKTKVTSISITNNKTPATKPKKKRTSLEDYIKTLDIDSEAYTEACIKLFKRALNNNKNKS